MNAPCLHKATCVGHDDRSDIHASGVGLVGKCEVGQGFVDGDVHRDVGASTAVVGEDGVRHRRLVGVSTPRDGPVLKHQVAGQRRMNAPCLNEATGVGHHDRTHVHISGVDLVVQAEVCQRLVDGDVHGDVG